MPLDTRSNSELASKAQDSNVTSSVASNAHALQSLLSASHDSCLSQLSLFFINHTPALRGLFLNIQPFVDWVKSQPKLKITNQLNIVDMVATNNIDYKEVVSMGGG